MRLSSQGFTLPELLLAVVILAFALSGLLVLFTNCIFLNEASRNLAIATSHAQYVLEGLRNTAFANILTNINNGVWDWNTQAVTTAGLSALDSESIDTQASGSNPIEAIVTVSWKDRGQRDRSLELRTLITNY